MCIRDRYKYNRKVVVEGRSMVNIIDTAMNLGCLNIPENTLINIEQLKNYPCLLYTSEDKKGIITKKRIRYCTH